DCTRHDTSTASPFFPFFSLFTSLPHLTASFHCPPADPTALPASPFSLSSHCPPLLPSPPTGRLFSIPPIFPSPPLPPPSAPLAVLKAKTVTQAAGSAYAEFGGTKVIVSVFGPRESRKAEQSVGGKGRLKCDVRIAPFATPNRNSSTQGGGGPVEDGRPRTCRRSGTKYGRRRAATPEPAESPVPGSTAPTAAPTPGSSAPVAAPTPGSPAPAAAPTLDSTAPAAAPAPGSSAPAAAPTPGSTAPAAAPAPGSSAPAVVPEAPGSVTPGAPLRRVQRRSYHARIWSREGSSRRGGEAPAPAERPAPEVPLLRLQ
ncbi:unnamed protein product, partial [Closterium sp. NIES-54]